MITNSFDDNIIIPSVSDEHTETDNNIINKLLNCDFERE